MDEAIMIDNMRDHHKDLMRHDDYEVLDMVYENDFEGEGREYREKVRNFYHVLAKEDQVLLFRFAISTNGFYKNGPELVTPIIKEDVLRSTEFDDMYNFEHITGMTALNHMLGKFDCPNTMHKLKKAYGFHELGLRYSEVKIIKYEESYEDIGKDYYLENKDEILEQFRCIKLDENAPILDHEQNYFLPILEKFLSYHKELIELYTTKPEKLEVGELGIAQNGSMYLSLGKSSYNLEIESEYSPDRIYRIMPDETLEYYTYLVLGESYRESSKKISDLFEEVKNSINSNSLEGYLEKIKLSKTPVKVVHKITAIDEEDLADFSVIEFNFSNTALRRLILKVSRLKRTIYKLNKLKLVRK